MEGEDEEKVAQTAQKDRSVIKIPSFQEVLESSQSKSNPSSFFAPSQTFSQAFSFLKSSEFYAPPSTSSASSSFSSVSTSQASENSASRQIDQLDASSSSSSAFAAAPSTPFLSSASNSNQSRKAILVSHRQKGNPLLKHIRNVRWDFADVIPDYILGQSSCALYLSVRYHLLHPDYLYYRIRELQKNFKLRIVLCHVDVEDVVKPLLEKTNDIEDSFDVNCKWVDALRKIHMLKKVYSNLEECGRYLETIKVYENKPADIIQGQMDTDYQSRLTHALTSVRHVNKTDVVTLGTTFGSLSNIMNGSMEDLARCPGIGERKVRRLYDTFHEPFKRVIPSQPAIFDSSTRKNAETLEVSEEKVNNTEDTCNQKQKEPEVTVKSTLSAAFAKYADKVGKKDGKVLGEKREHATAHANTENENNDS